MATDYGSFKWPPDTSTHGTVTGLSVVTANGFAGSVATPTSTPAITLSTTITGIIKGNGTAISAAVSGTDYQPAGNYLTALTGDGTASGPGSSALTLATVNSNVGSFTNVSITVNAKGLITAASSGSVSGVSSVSNSDGTLTISPTAGAVVASRAAITGDISIAGGSNSSVLATVNSNVGSFGGATAVGTFTVNGKGLVTAAGSTSIQIAESQVTNLVTDLAAKQSTTLTSAHILVGNVSNVATDVAMTGDISITNAGVTAYSGTVPINKGGTGQATKAPAFDALSPLTTGGDLLYGGASGTGTRLANGSSGQVLTSAGTTSAPTWSAVVPSSTTFIGSRAYINSGSITITAGTPKEIVFNNEVFDIGSNYNNTTGRFVAPTTGYYTFSSGMIITNGAVGPTEIEVYYLKNSTGGNIADDYSNQSLVALKSSTFGSTSGPVLLSAGDYISVWVSCTTQNVSVGSTGSNLENSYFSARFIGV